MSFTQIANYVTVLVLVIVAFAEGVTTAIHFLEKSSKKPLPKTVLDIDEIAEFIVNQYKTLDISGAEKKEKAVADLIDQLQNEGKKVNTTVAQGAIQTAYNKVAAQDKDKDDQVQPIGFVPTQSQDDDAKNETEK